MNPETKVKGYINKVPNLRPAKQLETFAYFKKKRGKVICGKDKAITKRLRIGQSGQNK